MGLFRTEAIESQRKALYGDVSIHQPARLKWFTSAICIITGATLTFASTASFTKREVVLGWIVPEQGLVEAFAPNGTVVQRVTVRTGQQVRKGQVLAVLSADLYSGKGSLGASERQQIVSQINELESQILESRLRQRVAADQFLAQAASLETQAGNVTRNKAIQRRLTELAEEEYSRSLPLAQKGFVSKFDQSRREQSVLTSRQADADLERQALDYRSQAHTLRTSAFDARLKQRIEESQLRASIAALKSALVDSEYKRGATLVAPASGEVVAVNANAGQTARATMPIVAIAPAGKLGAELLIPTRSSGFVRPGQRVRITIDAYPFERFGALNGHILRIDHSVVTSADYPAPIDIKDASYRVWLSLDRDAVLTYGVARRLNPGMTLQANIAIDRRTVIQWLLDPILATRTRL